MTAEPLFTVVVPTYRRPGPLTACLRALARLDPPRGGFEAIVVADEEADGSFPPGVESAAVRFPVRFLRQRHGGPGVARNTGASAARGRYIAFTDDDCAPEPDWLVKLAAGFDATSAPMIGGHTRNALDRNLYSEASQLVIDHVYRWYNADPGTARFFASNNMAVEARAFRELGGFEPTWGLVGGEDRDLCDRFLHAGHRLAYREDAVVLHAHELSPSKFWRQHLWYGQGAYRFHRTRASRNGHAVQVEPPRFYWNLLAIPFDRYRGARALALTGLICVSQGANAAGFFRERWWPPEA
jgi:glycosyltransferase involved in cell wall biosynthesis